MEDEAKGQEAPPSAEPAEEKALATPPQYESPEVPPDEPEAPAPVEAPVDEWDADTLQAAERYGFTADEAKSWGSKEAFERVQVALDRQAAKFGREQLKAWQEGQEQEQQAGRQRDERGRFVQQGSQEPVQQQQVGELTEKQKQQYKKLELALDPNVWDEDTIKTLSGINDHYDTVVSQQQARLDEQERLLMMMGERLMNHSGQSQADESQKLETEMDTFFDSLGDEFKDTFGKGPARLLASNGAEMISRNKLLEEMRVLDIADAQSNRPRQGYKELAKRAVRSLHYDKIKESARKEITNQLSQRQTQQLARASGHNGKAPSNRDVALKRVEDFYRSKGIKLSDWDDTEIEV